MVRRRMFTVLLLVAIFAIVAAWLAWQDVVPPTMVGTTRAMPPLDRPPAVTRAMPDASSEGSQPVVRRAADAPPREAEGPSGNLLVRVEWADGSRAPGVHVYLGTGGFDVFRTVAELRTDASGLALARVPAGRLNVSCDRAKHDTVEVRSGRRAEVTLSLWPGIDLEGVVRDGSGAPVPRAQIWLTNGEHAWCAGAFVAVADERGMFAVRAARQGQTVAAVAPGFQPSPPVLFTPKERTSAPVHVELVLGEPGGGLAGRVEDVQGNGIGGAIVVVATGRDPGAPARTAVMGTALPRRAFTATDGSYAIEGLAPGPHRVEVWAARFANAAGECTVQANEVTRCNLVVPRGVTVYGTVLDEDGDPVWRARVTARLGASEDPAVRCVFAAPEALTNVSGEYHLARLPAGELRLRAEPTRPRLRSETQNWSEAVVRAEPGALLEWRAQLLAGPTIRGVVRWRDGAPMVGACVTLSAAGDVRSSVTTDRSGRFRFVRLPPQAFDVTVATERWPKGVEPVVATGIWPDGGPLDLRAAIDAPRPVAKGSVRGTVVDAGRRIAPPGALGLTLEGSDSRSSAVAIDGVSFYFDGVAPGRLRVRVRSGDDEVHCGAWFELGPGEHKDIGALVTEPGGSLHICIDRGAGLEAAVAMVHATLAGTDQRRAIVEAGQRDLRFDNLSAGEYRLSAVMSGAHARGVSCTVVAGAVATATIELRPAADREFVIECTAAQQVTRMRIVSADGETVCDVDPRLFGGGPYRIPVQLPLGRFLFLVETEGGGKAETGFEMTSLAADQPPVVLQAK